jgi:hypothetical protein
MAKKPHETETQAATETLTANPEVEQLAQEQAADDAETKAAEVASDPLEQLGSEDDDAGTFNEQGVRVRKTLVSRMLIPTEDKDWILKNVVAKGKGAKAILGKIVGVCTETIEREGQLPNGTPSKMVVALGNFEMVNYHTGEVTRGTSAYFPAAYAYMLHQMLPHDREAASKPGAIRTVGVDVELGVVATGKNIPYEWTATAHREGKDMDILKKLRNARPIPNKQLLLTAPQA